MCKYILLCLLIFVPHFAIAGTRDPNVSDEKYIAYGQTFKSVGKISGFYKDGSQFVGSAIAIDDHHLLTAAHIINDARSIIFTTDNDKEYIILHVIIPKEFEMYNFNSGDIALGYSEKSFNLDSYPELYSDSDELGKQCSISGYGFTGTLITGGTLCDNKKRAGHNLILDIDANFLICDASYPDDDSCTNLEFFISSGDSGGGLFIDNKLAGINSYIFGRPKVLCSRYGENSGHTRISVYREWISRNKHKANLTSSKDELQ